MQTVVHLRVYEKDPNGGKGLSYNADGTVRNTNQLVKLPYNRVEYHNWLKQSKNVYEKVVVESYGHPEKSKDEKGNVVFVLKHSTNEEKAKIQAEVDKALLIEPVKKELSREELMAVIQKQQSQIDSLIGQSSPEKPEPVKEVVEEVVNEPDPDNGEMTLEKAKELYKEKFGKNPHHSKGLETILKNIEEAN